PDQVGFIPAYHAAERRIHISDAPVHVEDAHAGGHGIFHGAPETGFGDQGGFGASAEARVAPQRQQAQDDDQRQGGHHHEQPLLAGFLVYGHEHDAVVVQLLQPDEDSHDAQIQDQYDH